VRNHATSFWLTGDVEKQGEAEMTERLNPDALMELRNKSLIFMAHITVAKPLPLRRS
jgi:competence protein ComEC